jgi:hypothetical protein
MDGSHLYCRSSDIIHLTMFFSLRRFIDRIGHSSQAKACRQCFVELCDHQWAQSLVFKPSAVYAAVFLPPHSSICLVREKLKKTTGHIHLSRGNQTSLPTFVPTLPPPSLELMLSGAQLCGPNVADCGRCNCYPQVGSQSRQTKTDCVFVLCDKDQWILLDLPPN